MVWGKEGCGGREQGAVVWGKEGCGGLWCGLRVREEGG